jgi:kexin
MSLWGSTIDPHRAKEYEVPLINNQLPPVNEPEDDNSSQPSPTKTLTKPTAGLPEDHGTAEGEADKPAFGSVSPTSTATVSPTATLSPTLDEGWIYQMSNLISDQKWFFAALSVVALFGIGMGIFFWRRAVRRKRPNYSSLLSDDMALTSIREGGSAGGRTKELYDAFGEVSDDEDADEHTRLRPDMVAREGQGFQSGFLEDDPPQHAQQDPYRDYPSQSRLSGDNSPPESSGSWEHASQTR